MSDSVALGNLIHDRIFGNDRDKERREDKAKAEHALGKSADSFMSSLELQDEGAWNKVGMTKQEYKNLNPTERHGIASGLMMAQKYAGDQAQESQRLAFDKDAKVFQQVLQGYGAPAAGAPAGATASPDAGADEAYNYGQLPGSAPALDPKDFIMKFYAAGGSPRGGEWASQALKNLMGTGEDGNGAVNFTEDPETGTRFATLRNMMMPSGVNPRRASSAVAITGPNGEELGVGLPNKGGLTPLQTGSVKDKDRYSRLSRQLDSLITSQGKAAYNPKAHESYQKQIDAVLAQLAELEGPETPAAAPARPGSGALRYKLVNGKLQLTQ